MLIKMAVKDTPALLGNKLKQYYHKVRYSLLIPFCPNPNPNTLPSFYSLLAYVNLTDSCRVRIILKWMWMSDLQVLPGIIFKSPPVYSSEIIFLNVFRNIVGLAIGYSKAIVVDMALCLQV